MSAADGLEGGPLLADTSAWERATNPSVVEAWFDAVAGDRMVITPPVLIELLYSSRDQLQFETKRDDLSVFRSLPLTQSVARSAIAAMRELAAGQLGFHRVPLAALLIAAAAQEAGAAVLHYDHHYDRLAQVLAFESRWIAPAGSLEAS